MVFQSSGVYEIQSNESGTRGFYTFTPNLLQNVTIGINNELSTLLSKAHRRLGMLQAMSESIPEIDVAESLIRYKEAYYSCLISGIDAPLFCMLDDSAKPDEKTMLQRDCVQAYHHGINVSAKRAYHNLLLCDIQKILEKSDDTMHGFRETQTFVNKIYVTGKPNYNPPPPQKLNGLLKDLELLIRKNDIDELFQAATAHYQFETIHPFLSANGRVGRILPYMILAKKKILMKPLFSISQYLFDNKIEYIERMEAVQKSGRYEQWIAFFLEGIILAADEAILSIRKWTELRKLSMEKLIEVKNTSRAISVYKAVERCPISDIKHISEQTGLSYNTTANILELFVRLGILSLAHINKRNRSFIYTELLQCFSIPI